MAYIGRQQDGFGVRSRFIFTATGGQTTFTTDDSSNPLSYSDGAYVDVYLNGVLLDPSDYTATSLTSIVLDSGASASDILEVIVYDVFSVFSGTFTNGITANTATVTGDLTVDTNTLFVDASADAVGIGTSSPSGGVLHVKGAAYNQQLVIERTDTSSKFGLAGSDSGSFQIYDETQGNATRLVIDSSGNVGIGTSSPNRNLQIGDNTGSLAALSLQGSTSSNCQIYFGDNAATSAEYAGLIRYQHSTDTMQLWAGSTERMRISGTSPALSIGKTTFGTAGQGFTVYGNTAPQCYFNKSASGAVNGVLFYHSNSYVGGLNYNNTNTSLATSSDERLKDNIENSDDAGSKIDAMQVRQFDWKSTGEHQEYGFVAQELEPVFAHAIHTDLEGDYKSVDYGCLVPMLVKEIQSLRQRITDLENA